MDCALELRLCNTGPCSLLLLFLVVTPDFPLRRQPRGPVSGRAVYVCWLSFLEALVRQMFNGCVDWRALLLLILFVELRAPCISPTSKPISHLIWLPKFEESQSQATIPALLRLEVPWRELGRLRRRLCCPTGQSKTILLSSVFQLSEQTILFSSVFQFYLFV